jgi:hypothetical protein
MPGVPRDVHAASVSDPSESSAILFVYQYKGAVRNIYLKDPGPAPIDTWMGRSVWAQEGDTLVVDATGFNDLSWFDRAGNFTPRRCTWSVYTGEPDHLLCDTIGTNLLRARGQHAALRTD